MMHGFVIPFSLVWAGVLHSFVVCVLSHHECFVLSYR